MQSAFLFPSIKRNFFQLKAVLRRILLSKAINLQGEPISLPSPESTSSDAISARDLLVLVSVI